MTAELTVITGTVALITILARTIEKLVEKRANGKNGNGNGHGKCLSDQERDALIKMSDILTTKDVDGTPLVYVPRSLASIMTEIDHTLDRLSLSHEKMIFILERIKGKSD